MSKLHHVQLLRGLAALSIAVLHAQHDAAGLAARTGQSFSRLDLLPWAAGVDVFFVVSGFIMVHASRTLFGAKEARGVFLARRVARIVPLYWAVTTLYLLTALTAAGLLNGAFLQPWPIVASYLFIPFERPDGLVQPLYSLGWTLNYEMFFYALFALTLAWPRRQAVGALLALMASLVVLGVLVPLPQPFAFWTDPIILEFAFGLGLGLMAAEGVRASGPVRFGLAVLGLMLLALDFSQPGGTIVLSRAIAWGIPAALLVAAAALGEEHPNRAGPATRFGTAVGDASYALYLIHPFVIRAGTELAARTGAGTFLGPWGYVAAALLASVAVALLAYRWFERPLTDLARRRLETVRLPQWSSP